MPDWHGVLDEKYNLRPEVSYHFASTRFEGAQKIVTTFLDEKEAILFERTIYSTSIRHLPTRILTGNRNASKQAEFRGRLRD